MKSYFLTQNILVPRTSVHQGHSKNNLFCPNRKIPKVKTLLKLNEDFVLKTFTKEIFEFSFKIFGDMEIIFMKFTGNLKN